MKRRAVIGFTLLVLLVILSAGLPEAVASPPPEGSQMLRMYAPTESDYTYMTRSLSVACNPTANTVTVQVWFYVDSIVTSGTDDIFEPFMMFDDVLFLGTYAMYGAQIVYSSTGSLRLFANRYGSWGVPVPAFVDYLNLDSWYNFTQVHSGTTIQMWLNGSNILGITGVSGAVYQADWMRIGETKANRGTRLAYDVYVDWIDLDQTGGGDTFTEDFEGDLSAYTEVASTDGVIELVGMTQGGAVPGIPDTNFEILPSSQNGTYDTTLSFTGYCYNNDTNNARQFGLEIVSITGESWSWQIEETAFWLDPQETKEVDIYCFIGESGSYSTVLVRMFRYDNTSMYWDDSAIALSTGWGEAYPGQPGGPVVIIDDTIYALLGMFASFGFSAIGQAMVRGRGYLPAVLMFCVGTFFFSDLFIGWLPTWMPLAVLALLALLAASKVGRAFMTGGGE